MERWSFFNPMIARELRGREQRQLTLGHELLLGEWPVQSETLGAHGLKNQLRKRKEMKFNFVRRMQVFLNSNRATFRAVSLTELQDTLNESLLWTPEKAAPYERPHLFTGSISARILKQRVSVDFNISNR